MLKNKVSKFLSLTVLIILICSFMNLQWIQANEPKPFPDDEINQYIGKVVDPKVLNDIANLIESKYPDHIFGIKFKIIDKEEHWITDRGGQHTLVIKLKRILIAGIYDEGLKNPNNYFTLP